MKRLIALALTAIMLFCMTADVFAVGDGNIDGGGGGMGSGTSENKWIPGEEGVRVTVIRTADNAQASRSFDMTSASIRSNVFTFGIYSKLKYRDGVQLVIEAADYTVIKPTITMPQIISTGSSAASIDEIKRYFCSEYAVQLVANQTGIEYNTLINGEYKVLIEPVAYFLYNGNYFAMSAHQAALYDQLVSGNLRAKMASLSHKNLPLAMFLERPDLGYAAWNGTTSRTVSNDTIINYLGLGVVKFSDEEILTGDGFPAKGSPAPPEYIYRTDTDVITSVTVTADREYNPDNPLTARFKIGGDTYIVRNIVIPEDETQLVWVKWRTPPEPQDISIRVTVGGRTQYITARIEELTENEPPDPKANDRNDAFVIPAVPEEPQTETLSWGVWSAAWHAYWVWVSDWEWNGSRWVDNGQWVDNGWYDFTFNRYRASLATVQSITPEKAPTAISAAIKSGYGFSTAVEAKTESDAPTAAYTQAQTAVMHFPEFS
ncbi:MAG: hypothetical protein Q4C12_07660, partial [Clostridia bacterium]|nr:hypothetical protein [Clostridia bacterium]